MYSIENLIIKDHSFIQEKVYGSGTAIGWHRTNAQDFVDLVKEKGFQPGGGSGSMYGDALYSTYDIDSQLTPNMQQYGDFLIKFKIPIKNYLIFDKDIAQQIYGSNFEVVDQIKVIEKKDVTSKDFIERSSLQKKLQGISKNTIAKYPEFKKNFKPQDLKDYNFVEIISAQEVNNHLKKMASNVDLSSDDYLYQARYIIKDYMYESIKKYKLPLAKQMYNIYFWENGELISMYDIITKMIKIDKSNFFACLLIDNSNLPEQHYPELQYDPSLMIQMSGEIDYSSNWAKIFADRYLSKFKNVKGLIFTGRKDGKVIVSYNYNECIPMGVYVEEIENSKEKIEEIQKYFFEDCIKDLKNQKEFYTKEYDKEMLRASQQTVPKNKEILEELAGDLKEELTKIEKEIEDITSGRKDTFSKLFTRKGVALSTVSANFKEVIDVLHQFYTIETGYYQFEGFDLTGIYQEFITQEENNKASYDMDVFSTITGYIKSANVKKHLVKYQNVEKDILKFFISKANAENKKV